MGCGASQDAHDVPRRVHNNNNAPYPTAHLNNQGRPPNPSANNAAAYPINPGMAYPGQGQPHPGQGHSYPGQGQPYPGQGQPYPGYPQNQGMMSTQVHSHQTVVKVKRKKKKKNKGGTGAAIVGGMAMGIMVGGMISSDSMSSIFSDCSNFSFD